MPKIYNHAHFPVVEYAAYNPEKYQDMVANGALHSMRALPCTERGDVIQLDPRLQNSYPIAKEHFEEAGLEPAEEVIWDTSVEVAADFPDYEVSSYGFGDLRHAAQPNQKRYDATKLCNNKNRFLKFCEEKGYPIPKTITVDEDSPLENPQIEFPAYVKAARGSSGINIYRIANENELATAIEKSGDQYQIQEEVAEVISFLNVQYRALGSVATHLATSEQVLQGFAHQGNRYPADYDARHITDPLAGELASLGLEDVFAFDVAVTPDDMKLIECNARWNGSSYPTMIARKLGIPEWKTVTMPSRLEDTRYLDLASLTYSKEKAYGTIIINSSFLNTEGKVSAMIAAPSEAQEELEKELHAKLNKRYIPRSAVHEPAPAERIAA